jgi:hypothetical protein
MPEKAWAYYSSASDDEITIRENHAAFHRSVLTSRPGHGELSVLNLLARQDLVQATDPA